MMDYFEKLDNNPYEDLYWNIPEQKRGTINIVGGNSQSFRTEVKVAEYIVENYPLQKVNTILPDALKTKLPQVDSFEFLPSTAAGSFADTKRLTDIVNAADYSIIVGDLSKNTVTGKVIANACESSDRPVLVTRDTVDLLAETGSSKTLLNDNICIMGSLAQLQKVLRAVYYPKILILSQSLTQVAEVLHKFTLSYPVNIVTLHNGQIMIAKNGIVKAVPIEKSGYSPIMLWNGELAAKITALNIYNPHDFIAATIAATYHVKM